MHSDVRFDGAIEAETLNRLVLRRLLTQFVVDSFPQIMLKKMSFSLEEKQKTIDLQPRKSTSKMVSKRINQEVYCGGIVYHYLHQKQPIPIAQEKRISQNTTKSKNKRKC
jgi:hypothetical protein